MKRNVITVLLAFALFTACSGNKEQDAAEVAQLKEQLNGLETQLSAYQLKEGYIQHTVQFNLKWDSTAPETEKFLKDGKRILSALPMVRNFESLRQIGVKNNYKYYFTMVFENKEAYESYNNHPDHVRFVKERWETEVTDFLEADFVMF